MCPAMKYKRLEDEGTLRGKLHKFNIHSIRKKGDRFAGYLKFLTGVEPQVKDASIRKPMLTLAKLMVHFSFSITI